MQYEKKLKLQFYTLDATYQFAISFFLSTYVIYLLQNGLSFSDVSITNAVFMVSLFLLEVPTGIIADLYGRKLSFLLSTYIRAVAMLLFYSFSSLPAFCLASLVAAIADACHSGAYSAWVYDSLKHNNPEGDHGSIFPILGMIASASALIGGALGAVVATIEISYIWLTSALFFVIAGMMAHTIPEHYYKKKPELPFTKLETFKQSIINSLSHLFNTPILLIVTAIILMNQLGISAPGNFWQPYFKTISGTHDLRILGCVWALMSGTIFIAHYLSGKIKFVQPLAHISIALVLSGLSLFFLLFISNIYLALAFFLLHVFFNAYKSPMIMQIMHKNIPSELRATIGSWMSLVLSIGGAAGLLLSGFLADLVSLPFVLMISGMIFILQSLLVFYCHQYLRK